MKKDATPRTYRIPNEILKGLKSFREAQRIPPSETSIVVEALKEFLTREAQAQKGARR